MSTQIQFHVLTEKQQPPGAADAKWTGQIENLQRYPSYQNAIGLDGEVIQFEWTNFPGFATLTSLQEIQMDLERKMINDIEWKKKDENCISNAEKSRIMQTRFYQDIALFWSTFRKEMAR